MVGGDVIEEDPGVVDWRLCETVKRGKLLSSLFVVI